MLFTPVKDVAHVPYCGPTAIAALTGVPVSRIEKMIRRCRRGYKRRIVGTYTSEAVKVLRRLGCKVEEVKTFEPTFGKFVEDTKTVSAPYLVRVTGHFMTTFKGTFCDTVEGPRSIDGYDKNKRRVRQAWKVIAPAKPKYTTGVPKRESKPKPDIKVLRAAKLADDIKRWERKEKLAKTKLKKLRSRLKRIRLSPIPA